MRWKRPAKLMALAVVGCSSGGGGGGHYSENSCEYAFDGECDEPDYCAPGTDSYDCGSNAQPAPKASPTTHSARRFMPGILTHLSGDEGPTER